MIQEQICQILGLAAEEWPPDHYTLLGLKRGESDKQVIEERVHERMLRVRPFQLTYPDQVTEAMNRLAQAFSCLTDSCARKVYDESLRHVHGRPPAPPPANENGSIDPNSPLAWLFGPWDRLAEEESPASITAPQFRDWTSSVQPPRQIKDLGFKELQDRKKDHPQRGIPKEEAKAPLPRASLFWRHSNTILVLLSLMALLFAVWRQIGR